MNAPSAAQALAQTVAQTKYSRDYTSQSLGFVLAEVRPGFARMTAVVTKSMLNGLGSCHGGMTFTLADSTFGYACNSRNQLAVGMSCDIVYTTPAFEGDTLVAEAVERFLKGRNGVYDVTITNQKGDTVALFQGRSRIVPGQHVPNLGDGNDGD